MKRGFYFRIARNNVRKNYRFFIPRILSEIGLLGCFYIALTLTMDERLSQVKGGAYIPTLMLIGTVVLAGLSTVLMLYTNSFLMKQRKREFGVYNVLGMEKRHVNRVLFHESLISGGVAVICGLCFGILFYKLCSLLICRLLQGDILIGFYFITPRTIIPSALFFVLIDVLTFLLNCISIARMKPVELLQSKAAGEREPKVKWLMLVLGVLTLGAGYYLALTTEKPLEVLYVFFAAVVLVIIGTYFLFVTGSIFVLKALKKNSRCYYHKRRMPAISGLLYRMKQNAVGLASIAILATGVLVMISTTVSLYSGLDGTLANKFRQDLYFTASLYLTDGTKQTIPTEKLEEFALEAAEKNGVDVSSIEKNKYLDVSYFMEGNTFYAQSEMEREISEAALMNGIVSCIFVTEETYEELTGMALQLEGREIAVSRISSTVGSFRTLEGSVRIHGLEYPVTEDISYFPITVDSLISAGTCYGIVVSDDAVLQELYENQLKANGKYASEITERIAVTFRSRSKACAAGDAITAEMGRAVIAYAESVPGCEGGMEYRMESYWDIRESMIGMYGTLLFLGILLGAVCVFATVLIIYYKQISEGYEDRERFQIMEKIGMSRAEVKKTINSQVLLVFFLPLLVAGVHMCFAYPLLQKMLQILMLYDASLFLRCTLITYGVFAVVYVLIYSGTSRTYYKIVH